MSKHGKSRHESHQRSLFQREQIAWSAYLEVVKLLASAHRAMQVAWEERCAAEEAMREEYEIVRVLSECNREVWGEYNCIRDYNDARIASLRVAAKREEKEMKWWFKKADEEYEHGDQSVAPLYAEEGREHQENRDKFNEKIRKLRQETEDAKRAAKNQIEKADTSAFESAKRKFRRAKNRHEFARAEFNSLKAEHSRLKSEYEKLQSELKSKQGGT